LYRGKGRDIGKGFYREGDTLHYIGKAKDRWKRWERGQEKRMFYSKGRCWRAHG
jgi:hypothetical protein